jgi:hypothetical protein
MTGFLAIPVDFSWPHLLFQSTTALKLRSAKGRLVPMPDSCGGGVHLDAAGPQFSSANAFEIDNANNAFGLSADTFYYVYLYLDAGALKAEFSTTAWEWNVEGYPQKMGDASRLCVGCVYVNASIEWAYSANNVHVFSFFNQEQIGRFEEVTVSNGTSTIEVAWSGSTIELAVPYSVIINGGITGFFDAQHAPTTFTNSLFIDGTAHGLPTRQAVEVITRNGNVTYATVAEIAAGRHSFEARYKVDIGQQANAFATLWVRAAGQY